MPETTRDMTHVMSVITNWQSKAQKLADENRHSLDGPLHTAVVLAYQKVLDLLSPADNASVTVEIDEADQVDPPDVLMERFTDATTGRSDIDPHEVLWDILTDVRNMFKVSMAAQGVTPETASRIDGTVLDTLTNNYGED